MSFELPGMDQIKGLFGDKLKGFSLESILTSDFVQKNTKASSLTDLLSKFGVSTNSVEDLIKQPGIDEKVKEFTNFDNIKDMVEKAIGEAKK